jgi:ribosomal protein L22
VTPENPQDPQNAEVEAPQTETVADAPAEGVAVEQSETATETEAPKPKRSRKKAETVAEDASAAEDAPAAVDAPEDKPKRSRTKKDAGDEGGAEQAAAPAAKSRPARRREAAETVLVSAQAKYVRTSARKARLVCDHIRGKDVAEARAILAFTPRAAAKAWIKLLDSAVANAEHNHELLGEDLRVQAVYADEGPTLKRFRPRAMGRATQIRKRTSHLTIMLAPKNGAKGGR